MAEFNQQLSALLQRLPGDDAGTAQADAGQDDEDIVRERLLLNEMDGCRAYGLDLEYLWLWEIYQRDGKLVQSGCSISLTSAREAVNHVFAYYRTIRPAP